jgi:hypothetical protein
MIHCKDLQPLIYNTKQFSNSKKKNVEKWEIGWKATSLELYIYIYIYIYGTIFKDDLCHP